MKHYHYGYLLKNVGDGRYHFVNNRGEDITLTCGSCFEILVGDDHGVSAYKTCMEHDGNDYYAFGHKNEPLDNALVRIRM